MARAVSIKIPTPRAQVAEGWGEYHFALSLKGALDALGYDCSIDFFQRWQGDPGSADVNFVIYGGRWFTPPRGSLNLLWIISHPSGVLRQELELYDWVFVASRKVAEELTAEGHGNVSYLPQATDTSRFFPGDRDPELSHDVLFVGNRHKKQIRKAVGLALEAGVPLSVYGGKWDTLIPKANVAGATIPNAGLGRYYRSAGVVLNDHRPDMAANGFVSNRVYDVLASGRPLLTDRIEGLAEELLPFLYFYDDALSLDAGVAAALAEPETRIEERRAFARTIMTNHSFAARAHTIDEKLTELGQTRAAAAGASNYRFCVVTCIKNEGPYILEWVAHNLAIGVTDFLIFTNDCDDGSAEILDRLDDLGIVRHLPNPSQFIPKSSPHRACLNYAPYHRNFQEADYIVIIDVDEFITISAGDGTLNDLVRITGEPDVISLSELIFGFGGVERYEDGLVTEQFQWSNDLRPGKNRARRGVKSITHNSTRIREFSNHRPLPVAEDSGGLVWVDGSGRSVTDEFIVNGDRGLDCRGGYGHAILNHFTLRSGEGTLAKFERGDAVRNNRLTMNYFRKRNRNRVKPRHMEDIHAPLRAKLSELVEDDTLRRLHEASVARYRQKIDDLKATERFGKIWEEIQLVVRETSERISAREEEDAIVPAATQKGERDK